MASDDAQPESGTQGAKSDRWLRMLAESASDVVSYRTDSGSDEWVSASIEKQVGWTPAEFKARKFEDFVPEWHWPVLAKMRKALRNQKRVGRAEVQFRTKQGTLRWISLIITPVLSDAGAVIGRSLCWRDIQAEVEMRQERAESERQFRLLAETASDIVYSVDLDRRVTWVAPAVTRAFGWSADEIVGTVMSELVHPEDLVWSTERRDRLYAGDSVAESDGSFVLRMRSKGGDYRWVKTTLTTHRDADGVPLGWTGGMVLVDDLVEALERVSEERDLRLLMNDALFDAHILIQPVRDAAGVITDFRYIYVNSAAAKEYSLVPSEMLDLLLSKLEPGASETGMFDIYASVSEANHVVAFDDFYYVDSATGDEFYYEIRITPIPCDRLSVVWRDVTDRHRVRRRLLASEEHFRLIAENAVDVVQVSRDNLTSWVSPSLERMFGWRPEEWVGCDCIEFVHEDDRERADQARLLVSEGGGERDQDLCHTVAKSQRHVPLGGEQYAYVLRSGRSAGWTRLNVLHY